MDLTQPTATAIASPLITPDGVHGPVAALSVAGRQVAVIRADRFGFILDDLSEELRAVLTDEDLRLGHGADDERWGMPAPGPMTAGEQQATGYTDYPSHYLHSQRAVIAENLRPAAMEACALVGVALRGIAYGRVSA